MVSNDVTRLIQLKNSTSPSDIMMKRQVFVKTAHFKAFSSSQISIGSVWNWQSPLGSCQVWTGKVFFHRTGRASIPGSHQTYPPPNAFQSSLHSSEYRRGANFWHDKLLSLKTLCLLPCELCSHVEYIRDQVVRQIVTQINQRSVFSNEFLTVLCCFVSCSQGIRI